MLKVRVWIRTQHHDVIESKVVTVDGFDTFEDYIRRIYNELSVDEWFLVQTEEGEAQIVRVEDIEQVILTEVRDG